MSALWTDWSQNGLGRTRAARRCPVVGVTITYIGGPRDGERGSKAGNGEPPAALVVDDSGGRYVWRDGGLLVDGGLVPGQATFAPFGVTSTRRWVAGSSITLLRRGVWPTTVSECKFAASRGVTLPS